MSVKVNALDHIVINVADVARSAEWYRKILGMEVKVFDPGPGKTPRTSLMFGDQKINVRPLGADKVEWFTADHETAGSDDLCFLMRKRIFMRMTGSDPDSFVVPAKAGTHSHRRSLGQKASASAPKMIGHGVWVPAFAGTTSWMMQIVKQQTCVRAPRRDAPELCIYLSPL